ncbi:MAG: hypothetical protein OXE85_06055 [Roseovarius sp.]|nr:hypothetical protein [Roseovarius sp.]MCY4317318.1 hypothetical protein [Roseovarius sp.]
MIKRHHKIVAAVIATLLMAIFVVGLAHSISTGFAGFWGGLPFWIIVIVVLSLAIYDVWEETIRNGNDKGD